VPVQIRVAEIAAPIDAAELLARHAFTTISPPTLPALSI
jgi:hypothetical protein